MERRLIKRALSGNLDAYDAIVSCYQSIAFRTAWLTIGDADEAEDAVQEAFVKAYLNLGTFDLDASFRPWLLRIVTNEALNRHRSHQRRASLHLRASNLDIGGMNRNLPEDLAIAAETQDRVIDALNRLSERDRTLVAYRYFLDLEPAEIADILDRPASTIRTQISRALVRLRDFLSETTAPRPTEPSEKNGGGR